MQIVWPHRRAAIYNGLFENDEWIERRFETIRLLDADRYLRSVSIDINLGLVRSLCAGLIDTDESIVLPVEFLKRGLIEDLKVRDDDGNRLPVALSEEVDQVWCDALYYRAGFALGSPPPAWLTDEIMALVERIDRSPAFAAVKASPRPRTVLSVVRSDVSVAHGDIWKLLVEDAGFFDMLRVALSTSFVGIRVTGSALTEPNGAERFSVRVSSVFDPNVTPRAWVARRMAAWAWETALSEEGDPSAQQMKHQQLAAVVDRAIRQHTREERRWRVRDFMWGSMHKRLVPLASSSSFGQRTHIRIIAPHGTVMARRCSFLTFPAGAVSQEQTTSERVMLYYKNSTGSPSKMQVVVWMIPRLRQIPIVGSLLGTIIVNGIILLGSSSVSISSGSDRYSPANDTGSTIALVALSASFAWSIYAAQEHEHDLAAKLLFPLRVKIASGGVLSLLVAALVMLGVNYTAVAICALLVIFVSTLGMSHAIHLAILSHRARSHIGEEQARPTASQPAT